MLFIWPFSDIQVNIYGGKKILHFSVYFLLYIPINFPTFPSLKMKTICKTWNNWQLWLPFLI